MADKSNKQHNPWKRTASRDVYNNPWIKVREDNVINPSGGEGIYGVVHFKNLAIGIIPIDPELNTWLVGQYRYTLDEYSWEIPMGGGDPAIAPVDSAKRELKEETGLTAKKWEKLLKIHTSNSVTDEVGFVFIAEELTIGKPEFEETEKITIRKLPLSDALKMIEEGKITDSVSVGGLLALARKLHI